MKPHIVIAFQPTAQQVQPTTVSLYFENKADANSAVEEIRRAVSSVAKGNSSDNVILIKTMTGDALVRIANILFVRTDGDDS